jgi:peptidoglycan/xylan/chitin deacetylase (PgdA/CDA1 family)
MSDNKLYERDFIGYRGSPPDPRWPNQARIAVSFVVNFEEGAELTLSGGDERNESSYETTAEIVGYPDLCMESHYEYSTRAAYWRVMSVFAAFGVPVTLNACGKAVATSPWLAQDVVARGHEVACHGWRWEQHYAMDIEQERSAIAKAVQAIEAATGIRPVGWHTRSTPSVNTRRLLVEEFGFEYDSDAYNDDLPYFLQYGSHSHVVVPYAFDTNDMRYHFGNDPLKRGTDLSSYVNDAFDWLWEEGATAPKMMSVGLHLRRIGRPGRMKALHDMLSHMTGRGQTWFARRQDIARHWRQTFLSPSSSPRSP